MTFYKTNMIGTMGVFSPTTPKDLQIQEFRDGHNALRVAASAPLYAVMDLRVQGSWFLHHGCEPALIQVWVNQLGDSAIAWTRCERTAYYLFGVEIAYSLRTYFPSISRDHGWVLHDICGPPGTKFCDIIDVFSQVAHDDERANWLIDGVSRLPHRIRQIEILQQLIPHFRMLPEYAQEARRCEKMLRTIQTCDALIR